MAKTKPGLPDGFQINLVSPSTLGDYLDEGFDENVARAIGSKRAVAAPVEQRDEMPTREQPTRQAAPQLRPHVVPNDSHLVSARNDQVLSFADVRGRNTPKMQVPKRPDRIQFNMRPETQKMFGEIVEFVQRYSLQEDAKPSGILDAVISVLHQSRR